MLTARTSLKKLLPKVIYGNHMSSEISLEAIKACIPPLDGNSHKGQCGRIGIIGGSFEYTGAPYFAAISALKVGADLAHVFCASSAATVIKSYSPELIVHPLLDSSNALKEISSWLERIHVLVIGPGLGREPKILLVIAELIHIARRNQIPLVLDADGLYLITQQPKLIQDYPQPGVILTPNKIEFDRLQIAFGGDEDINLSKLGKNVTILIKGKSDMLCSYSSEVQWEISSGGSGRRCGGQGDLLSGCIAIFLHWTLKNNDKLNILPSVRTCLVAASLSCYAASKLIRLCNEKAYKDKGRSMLATDMINYIHVAFEELLGK